MGGPVGRFGADRFALFINGLMPASMRRRKLSLEEMRAYRAPFSSNRTRRPMHVFPWQITAAKTWLGELEAGLSSFEGPVRFIWPNNDIAFRGKELARWLKIFPHASVVRLSRCGHYLWEDAPDECISQLRGWLADDEARAP